MNVFFFVFYFKISRNKLILKKDIFLNVKYSLKLKKKLFKKKKFWLNVILKENRKKKKWGYHIFSVKKNGTKNICITKKCQISRYNKSMRFRCRNFKE